MNIISCFKVGPESQDIETAKNGELILDKGDWKIGEYDLPAIECGRLLLEEQGGTFSGVTVGDSRLTNSKLKKEILSRGMSDLYAVIDETAGDLDSYQTASVLAHTIKERGNVDIIFCGTGSSDMYSQSVGNQLGALLDIPAIDNVKEYTVKNDTIEVVRVLEDGTERLTVTLPAVISVTADCNVPKIPGMKDILAAGKKKTNVSNLADIPDIPSRATAIISTLAPVYKERKKIVKEVSDEAVAEFAEALRSAL